MLVQLVHFQIVLPMLAPEAGFSNPLAVLADFTLASLSLLLIPVPIGIAILHYRLYDIDLIINRTLVYGALTGLITGLYVLAVGGLGVYIQQGTLVPIVMATGVVALFLGPLHGRLQRGVDRLVPAQAKVPSDRLPENASHDVFRVRLVKPSGFAPTMALALWALSLVLLVGFVALYALVTVAAATGDMTLPPEAIELLKLPPLELLGDVFHLLGFLAFVTLGVLIVSRRPENRIGWLFCLIGFGEIFMHFAIGYAVYGLFFAPAPVPGSLAAAWLQNWSWVVNASLLVVFLPLLFPSGRLPSPRWRFLAWLALGAMAVLILGAMFHPGPLWNGLEPFGVENPLGVPAIEPLIMPFNWVAFPLLLLSMLAAAASVFWRLRRASGDERQQLKWFAYFAGIHALLFVTQGLVRHILDIWSPAFEVTLSLVWGLAFVGLPIATGLAILKYRLYDIDLLINRTLVYGALTASVIGIYTLRGHR
jgi:hypothetical protein